MMQRARKLIGMSQDDLSRFRPRPDRSCSGRAGDAPRRGDLCICFLSRI
jgi:hypothetical protein